LHFSGLINLLACLVFIVIIFQIGCLTEDCRRQRSSTRPIIADHYSKSVPNGFDRCALEQDIGMELRAISDSFHLECGGFVSSSVVIFNLFCSVRNAQGFARHFTNSDKSSGIEQGREMF